MSIQLERIIGTKKRLERAKEVKKNRNNISLNTFKLPIWDFLIECYTTCTPNKYGQVFPKKISFDSHYRVKELSSDMDRGDLHSNYKTFFEGKISFKNKNGNYSITNIRSWQELDYFILCFVNTENNLTPKFYCVPKDVVTNNPFIKLTGMNNKKNINEHNRYVGMRASISQSDIDVIFKRANVLKGTNYKNLLTFIKNLN